MTKFKLESFPSLKRYLGENYLVGGDSRKRDLYKICTELGIAVYATKFNDDSLSGLIRKTDEGWEIYVNDTDSPERKSFTIAHELGHYFSYIDKQQSYNFINDNGILEDKAIFGRTTAKKKYSSDEMARMEAEANFIASNLLMPDNLVNSAFLENKNIEEMADEFGVSGSAMGFRLVNLGLIPIESIGVYGEQGD